MDPQAIEGGSPPSRRDCDEKFRKSSERGCLGYYQKTQEILEQRALFLGLDNLPNNDLGVFGLLAVEVAFRGSRCDQAVLRLRDRIT